MKIGSKLILIIGMLAVVSGTISGTIYYFVAEQSIETRTKAQLESVAVLKENQLNEFIKERINDVEGFARERFFVNSFIRAQEAHANQEKNERIHHENIKQLLKEKLTNQKDFFEFFILDLNGEIHVSTDETQIGKFRASEDYFVEGGKRTCFQNFYFDTALQQPAVTIATPIKDNEGKVRGVLAGRVNLDKISKIMIERSGLGETGETLLVNKFNLLVSQSRFIEEIEFRKVIHTEAVKDCLKGNNGFRHYNDYRNVPVLGVYRWLFERELCLLVKIDKQEAFRPIDRLKFIILLIGLGSVFSTLIIGLLITQTISRPIIKLRDATRKISKGDLGSKIEVKSKDEIGELAASFNQMVEDLQKTTVSIRVLQEEQKRFQDVVTNIGDWIWEVDAQGRYTYSNPIVEQILGYKPEKVIGKFFYDFFLPEEREELKKAAFEFFAKKQAFKNFLNRIIGKDGQIVIIETSGVPVVNKDGRLLGYRGADCDITDRVKAEQRQTRLFDQLEKTNQELKDFAYIVSHDLKAPLRGINTLVKWISGDYADKFDQEGKEQMNLLLSRVDRMHNLIDGILQYSRIGRINEEKVQVNLNELVPDIIDILAPPENITITIEKELPVIECEATRITQVFQNLMSNAVNYMDKPQGQIRIGCVEEESCWRFSVTDNGPGIEEKYFEKIFQMFQTLSPRDEFESTGVGLSVVKKIIEMHGGRIWVESKVGEGSRFLLTLPKQKEEG